MAALVADGGGDRLGAAQEKKLIIEIKKSTKHGQMLVHAASAVVSALAVNTKVAKAKTTGNELYYFV
ncbi:hypothetical protein Dimus_027156 [Dionaea muscipula]